MTKSNCIYCGKPTTNYDMRLDKSLIGAEDPFVSFAVCKVCTKTFGTVAERQESETKRIRQCSSCNGTGKIKGYTCCSCDGTGQNS